MVDRRTPEQRRRDADALQAIEGNPLTDDEKRMFEMFDREGWSGDQRREYIRATIKKPVIAAE